jgi:parvulin-like peptidyl-prolyl isomerase
MEYSLGPEGEQGGDLGYFEAGQMPEEFDDVFKLKINKVSDIIKTPYGFHLLKVVDKIEERKMDFEESKSRVEKILLEYLQDQAFKKWFLKLKQNAEIEIEYESLEKIN